MSDSSAHSVERPAPTANVGSISWAWDTFLDALKSWRATIVGTGTFIAGAVFVVIFMAILELPGGVLPAIPVLTINLVPHSLRMLLKRILIIVVTLMASFLIYSTFEEQPWILLLVGMSAAYFGLYLVGRGMDMLSYLLGVAVPVLLSWEAAMGKDLQASIWMSSEQLLVGILVTGILGIIFLQPQSERNLRNAISKPLRQIAAILRTSPLSEPEEQPQVTATSLAMIERLLGRFRAESGRTARARNLHVVADTVRMMISWNQLRSMLHSLHFKDEQYTYLYDKAMSYRNLMASQLEENAEALLQRRNARSVPGMDTAALDFRKQCIEGIRSQEFDNVESASIAQAFAFLCQHGVHMLEPMTGGINEKLYTPPEDVPLQSREHRRPWSAGTYLLEAATNPDRAVGLFAMKGVIVGMIAFALATVFSYWGGAVVLLLMALLLTPQSMGAVASGYMLRMLGLGIAVVVCLLGVLLVIPDINDPWTYGLLLAVALLPGAIASQTPNTIALGIGYCMSVFFMLTQPDRPSVDLTSVQDRFVSVAVATSLAWLVFIGFKPVYARTRIGEQLRHTCKSIAEMFKLAALPPRNHLESIKESDAWWDVYMTLDQTNHTIADSKSEFASERERYRALTSILSRLEQMFVLGRFELRVRAMIDQLGESNELIDGLEKALEQHAAALVALGEFAINELVDPTPALDAADSALSEIAALLRKDMDPHGDELKHCVFAQYAGLLLLQRYCQELWELLKIRQKSLRKSHPFAIGGTQMAQSVFAEQS